MRNGIMMIAMRVAHLPEEMWPWVNLEHIAALVPIADNSADYVATEIRFTGGGAVKVSLSPDEIRDVMQQAAARVR